MKSYTGVSIQELKHLVKLAKLKLSEDQLQKLAPSFKVFLDYVSKIKSLDTKNFRETSQVTGRENVFRDDVVDEKRMLTQDEALSNAKRKHQGFFLVDALFNE